MEITTAPPPIVMPIGRKRLPLPDDCERSPEQRALILGIIARPDFDFACSTPGYGRRFAFTWYDRNGRLHSTLIIGDCIREEVVVA